MDTVKQAIRLIRKHGGYISKFVANYIYEEYEEDLFPYSYGDGSLESVVGLIWELLDEIQSGKVDLRGTYEQRLSRRYEALKEEHLDLLCYVNRLEKARSWADSTNDNLPF